MTERSVERCKEIASREVVETIFSQINKTTILGIGSGTTILYFIQCLADRIVTTGMAPVRCVPTSYQTRQALLKHSNCFSLLDWSVIDSIDVYVDGLDAFSADFVLIKGKGGALFEEKVAFKLAKTVFIIADWTKRTVNFATCPIPIEIIPSAYCFVKRELQKLSIKVTVREGSGKVGPTISENGNFLLDAEFEETGQQNPRELESRLKSITGIVESGIFCAQQSMNIFIGNQDGTISKLFAS